MQIHDVTIIQRPILDATASLGKPEHALEELHALVLTHAEDRDGCVLMMINDEGIKRFKLRQNVLVGLLQDVAKIAARKFVD